jgi:uroporphyrinogen decarboxylase
MADINMKQWIYDAIHSQQRLAVPIMTHPGIEAIGKHVVDACCNGDVHAEAIIALNALYPSAAATAIMDLTVEAEAFGAKISFPPDEVPSVSDRLLSSKEDVDALIVPSVSAGRIPEYIKANKKVASTITNKPVFAGCIGPFSLAGRLYGMTEIMMALYIEPDTIKELLSKCAQLITAYLQALKATGINGVIMAEPASGLLSNKDCQKFSSDYIRPIINDVQDERFAVILHNCGNNGHCTEATISCGAMGYHFGNKANMVSELNKCPKDVLVMGNIDPVGIMQQGTAEEVSNAVTALLEETKSYPNFILSTGCDVPPNTPVCNIEAFYKSVLNFNKA